MRAQWTLTCFAWRRIEPPGLPLPCTAFITRPDSFWLRVNQWRTDKDAFLHLFSLINMFWLAEQSHRQSETARISAASEWVSCIDRKLGAFMRAMHWFPTTLEKKRASCGEKCHVWCTTVPSLTAGIEAGKVALDCCHLLLLCYNTNPLGYKREGTFFKLLLLTDMSSKRKLHSQWH